MDERKFFAVELPNGKYAVAYKLPALFQGERDRIRIVTVRPLSGPDCLDVMNDMETKPKEEWQSITIEATAARKRKPRVVREETGEPSQRRKRA